METFHLHGGGGIDNPHLPPPSPEGELMETFRSARGSFILKSPRLRLKEN